MDLLINEVIYDDKDIGVIINKLYDQRIYPSDIFKYYYDIKFMKIIYDNYGCNSKQLFKDVFGRQQTCKIYTNRYWIWTFSNIEKTATVYCVIDNTGISWEYKLKSIFSEVIKIKQELEKRILEHRNGNQTTTD